MFSHEDIKITVIEQERKYITYSHSGSSNQRIWSFVSHLKIKVFKCQFNKSKFCTDKGVSAVTVLHGWPTLDNIHMLVLTQSLCCNRPAVVFVLS